MPHSKETIAEIKRRAQNRKSVGLPPSSSSRKNERFNAQIDLRNSEQFLKTFGGEGSARRFKKKAGLIEQPTRKNMHPNTQEAQVEKIVQRRRKKR